LLRKPCHRKIATRRCSLFASLLHSDEGKRLSLADAAIRSDPGLTWIDFANAVLPANDITNRHPLFADRIARLISSDPDNALPHLLRSESITAPYRHKDAQNDPNALHAAAWGAAAATDPQWLAAMDAAFKAPRYDAYDQKLFLLSRDVMERYSVNDPRIFSAMLGRRSIYQYSTISAYSKLLRSRVQTRNVPAIPIPQSRIAPSRWISAESSIPCCASSLTFVPPFWHLPVPFCSSPTRPLTAPIARSFRAPFRRLATKSSSVLSTRPFPCQWAYKSLSALPLVRMDDSFCGPPPPLF
jgi:hypothetical protein